MPQTTNVLALIKESERYVFLYDDASGAALIQTLTRFAADEDLSFTWHDASVLTMKVKLVSQWPKG